MFLGEVGEVVADLADVSAGAVDGHDEGAGFTGVAVATGNVQAVGDARVGGEREQGRGAGEEELCGVVGRQVPRGKGTFGGHGCGSGVREEEGGRGQGAAGSSMSMSGAYCWPA